MKTMAELQAIRDRLKNDMSNRDDGTPKTKVVVGMATCGIAAGARPVLAEFAAEVDRRNLAWRVAVTQTGCLGYCRMEPIVEVFVPGQEKVTYIKMTPDKVSRIVKEHIEDGRPVKDYLMSGDGN